MTTFLMFLLPLLVIALLMLPLVSVYKTATTGKQVKARMALNLVMFFGICLIAAVAPLGGIVSAAGEAASEAAASMGWAYVAAALSTGLSALGAGIAVAAAAPAAIGAFSEDPKAFGKALIFVALGEGVALYGLLISILILNKV